MSSSCSFDNYHVAKVASLGTRYFPIQR
jgi:hypothetical protein